MRVKWRFSSTLMHLIKWLWEFYEIWVTSFVQLSCTRSNEHERCMRVKWRFSSTLMHLIKRLWEFYEIWVTRFVQLSCTWSNEHESCMRVELPDLSNSHVLGQTSMKIAWELSDQFCSALIHSVKQAWKLYESWVTSFVQLALMHFVKRAWQLYESWVTRFVHSTLMHSVKRAGKFYESWVTSFVELSCTRSNDHGSCKRVEWPVLISSYALGQTSTRVVWNWVTSFVQLSCTRSNEHESSMRVEWPVLFNSRALGQTSMKVVWELSDQFCSTLMYSVKRAWKLYESWVTRFVQLSCTRSKEHENCMRVEWPVLFNSHALGQTIMRVLHYVWELSDHFCSTLMYSVKRAWELYEGWVTTFVQLSCTRSDDYENCMRVEWPVLFNSHALGQTIMRVVWELSNQFCSALMHSVKRLWELYESWVTTFVQLSCTRSNEHELYESWVSSFVQLSCLGQTSMRVEWRDLFNSHALGQMSMRVVWELSDQFFSTLMHSVKQARELFEIELPILLNSYALGQMFKRKSCMRVEWAIFFNSHALDQMTMRVVGESSDQFCSTVMHSVKRAWQLYES